MRIIRDSDFIDFLQWNDIFILCETYILEEEISFVEPLLHEFELFWVPATKKVLHVKC